MKNQLWLYGVLSTLLLSGVPASQAAPKAASKLGEFDINFLKTVNESNNSEVAYVPGAIKHSSNVQIKQFGQQMVHDHTQANKELVALAKSKGVKLPHDVPDEEKAVIDRLNQEHGAKFDAAYKNEMMRDHTEDINDMEREISLGTDPQVKAYATKYLPILKHHFQMAQELDVATGAGAGSKMGAMHMAMPKPKPMGQ